MMALALASILSFPTAANAGMYSDDIQKLYVAYFGRPADPSGLQYWESVVEVSGQTALASIANTLTQSAEYQSQVAGLNSEGIINQIYQNLFGHAPDPDGLMYWSQKLSSRALTTAQIAQAITDAAAGADKDTFANKVAAATAFTQSLDTTYRILGYSGQWAGAAARDWLSTIGNADSLEKSTATAALNQTIEKVIAAKEPPKTNTTDVTTDAAKNNATDAANQAVNNATNQVIGTAVDAAVKASQAN